MRRFLIACSLALIAGALIPDTASAQSSMGVPPTIAVQRAQSHTTQPPTPTQPNTPTAPAEKEKTDKDAKTK